MTIRKIYIGSDHAGYELKEYLLSLPFLKKYEVIDVGTNSNNSCSYFEFALKVSLFVKSTPESIGILICGSGTGMCIGANKVKGIRAVVGYDKEIAKLAVEHNNANVLCFGARFIKKEEVPKIIEAFLEAEFQKGRHLQRVAQIMSFEDENN